MVQGCVRSSLFLASRAFRPDIDQSANRGKRNCCVVAIYAFKNGGGESKTINIIVRNYSDQRITQPLDLRSQPLNLGRVLLALCCDSGDNGFVTLCGKAINLGVLFAERAQQVSLAPKWLCCGVSKKRISPWLISRASFTKVVQTA